MSSFLPGTGCNVRKHFRATILVFCFERKKKVPVSVFSMHSNNKKNPPYSHEFTCLPPVPHPHPPPSTPWSNNAALSQLVYPSAPLEEERRAGSSEQLKGSQTDVQEDRRDTLTSSHTTSFLSIFHLNHPITLPSGHVTTATDTADTGPDDLELWLAGRCMSHWPARGHL